jgi:hypothetical protein
MMERRMTEIIATVMLASMATFGGALAADDLGPTTGAKLPPIDTAASTSL